MEPFGAEEKPAHEADGEIKDQGEKRRKARGPQVSEPGGQHECGEKAEPDQKEKIK